MIIREHRILIQAITTSLQQYLCNELVVLGVLDIYHAIYEFTVDVPGLLANCSASLQ